MRWRALAGGFALALSPGWNLANVGAVADELSHVYGVSLAVVGLFTTALFVTHAAFQIPAGRLCDRYGARRVGALGLTFTAVASAAMLVSPQAGLTISLRAAAGIGTAFSFVAGSDYVRSTVGSAFAQGLYGAVSMAGGGLALALIPHWQSWRAPFASAVVVAGVGVLVVLLSPRERARPPLGRAAPIADRRLAPLAAMHAASFGLSVILGNWVVTLLERNANLSSGVAGAVGALILLLGVITRPLGGRLYGRTALVRASFLAGGVAAVAIALATGVPGAVAASAVAGLAAGIPFAPAFTGAARLRPDAPGAAVGVVNMAAAVTILVGTPLVGLTFSLPGDGRVGFVVVAALWAATAAAVPRTPPSTRIGSRSRSW